MGLSEGINRSQGGNTSSTRKPPVRFIVNPGEADVIAEFAGFNSGAQTRSMTTTVVRSKTIQLHQQSGNSGTLVGVQISAGNDKFGGLAVNSTLLYFELLISYRA